MLRRGALLLLTAVLGVALVAPPASADSEGGPGRPHLPRFPTSGTFDGSGSYELFTVCAFAWEVIEGTFDGSRRPGDDGTFTLDFCVAFEQTAITWTGTFDIETASGATLSGPAAGTIDLGAGSGSSAPFELTLTVTESSGTPRPVTGTITLTGLRTETGTGTFEATVTGTFTSALHM